jgi:hypothetical protein
VLLLAHRCRTSFRVTLRVARLEHAAAERKSVRRRNVDYNFRHAPTAVGDCDVFGVATSASATMKRLEVVRPLAFPAAMLLACNVPVLNSILLSGHGGFGWFLLPAAFVYACVAITRETIRTRSVLFLIALLAYLLLAWPASRAAEQSVNQQIGLTLNGEVYVAATFPFGLLLLPHEAKPRTSG